MGSESIGAWQRLLFQGFNVGVENDIPTILLDELCADGLGENPLQLL